MKQKLLAVLLIASLTGMMFAGCQTTPEVPDQPQDNVITENNQSDETTTPTEKVAPSEQPTKEPTSAVAPVEPTKVPEPTDAPVTTVTPTDIPEVTEETVATATLVPTATPEPTKAPEPTATIAPTATVAPTATQKPTAISWPIATPWPTPTPGPTPSVSQIEVPKNEQISFPVYKCGEKGEEVLALVKSLREEAPNSYPNGLIELLSAEYNYSEQDILYGVYNSGWKEWCTEIATARIEQRPLSEYELLKEIATTFPYIEEDVVYAVEHCGADWNQEATESLDRLLYASFSKGTSYIYSVVYHKEMGYTNEQIEYALNAMGEIDWEEQARKKIKMYTGENGYGISYPALLDRLVYSHNFDYQMSVRIWESIKDEIDWNAEAVKAAKYFAPYRSDRDDLLQALVYNKFTLEQAEYAAKAIGW